MKKTIVILIGFLIYYLLLVVFDFHTKLIKEIEPGYLLSLCFHFICLIPIGVSFLILFRPNDIPEYFGLNKNVFMGAGVALLCTSPMILSSMMFGSFNLSITVNDVFRKIIFSGFFEELVFRGFLFGLLFRYAKWGFIPAALIGVLFFGIGHLYQGSDVISALASFGVTALGAIWFSWMYVEWRYNLWLPISMHVFMNASWILFSVSNTAVGDVNTNIFRGITIVSIIIVTIVYKRLKQQPYYVNRHTLWVNQ